MLYVNDNDEVIFSETMPELFAQYHYSPRNDAGGEVQVWASWVQNLTSVHQDRVLARYLRQHPEYLEEQIFGIDLQCDTVGYGVCDVDVFINGKL